MKKIYTLVLGLFVAGTIANAQIIFQSNMDTWLGPNNDSIPADFTGATNNFNPDSIIKITVGANFGTNTARLVNSTTSGKRLSSNPTPVTNGTSYEVKFWVKGEGDIAARVWSGTYAGSVVYQSINTSSWTEITKTVTANATVADGQFIIYARNTRAAGGHIEIDRVEVSNLTVPFTSIYDIQTPGSQADTSQYFGQTVLTGGIVTAKQAAGKYWVQSGTGPYSGVYVFDSANNNPNVGDSVTFTAQVAEYFNLTELINISNFTVVSSGNTLPTATTLSTNAVNNEQYEGVLVSVINASCISDTTSNSNQEWSVNDGSGDVIVDGFIFPFGPAIGTDYNVTGVVDYNFGNFKILPRNINDIQISTSINEFDNVKVAVYPNPVQNFINFDLNINNYSVRIVDITGKTVSNSVSTSNKHKVNTTNFNNGIYFYTISNNGNTITTNKFIVAK